MKISTRVIHHCLLATTLATATSMTAFDASAALADVPQVITHQGRLFDALGDPFTGTEDIKFSIYDAEDAGNEIWTETLTVDFDEGFFSIQLGELTVLDEVVFDGSTRWLGITVGADPEMSPRAAVASVPYAMIAGDVLGTIHPTAINIQKFGPVINDQGQWVGDPTGLIGPAGPAGTPGPDGPAGPKGDKGDQGDKGDKGVQGDKGDKGDQGLKGDKGDQGLKGDVGDKGDKGDQGQKGDKGDKGDQGVQGVKGDQGIQGLKGDQGQKGDQGIQGLKGDTGDQGIQGLKGDKGDQGIQGLKGDTGDQGVKGDQGIQGLKGDKGDTGDQGIQGLKGDTGDQGIQGLKGDPGLPGSPGLPGAPGLQGDKGDKGDKGNDGTNGINGTDGIDGIDGAKGDKGDSGVVGSVFATGVGAAPSTTLDFIATTVQVVLGVNQKIQVVSNRALGASAVADGLTLDICYQDAVNLGPVTRVANGPDQGLKVPAEARVLFETNAVITTLPAGTYNVGMCGVVTGNSMWDEGGYGMTSALVFN